MLVADVIARLDAQVAALSGRVQGRDGGIWHRRDRACLGAAAALADLDQAYAEWQRNQRSAAGGAAGGTAKEGTALADLIDAQMQELAVLRGAGASFMAYDVTRGAPLFDPTGAVLGAATPTIHELLAGARELRLAGLPGGYVISSGDYVGFACGLGPVRQALHRVVTGGVAGVGGTKGCHRGDTAAAPRRQHGHCGGADQARDQGADRTRLDRCGRGVVRADRRHHLPLYPDVQVKIMRVFGSATTAHLAARTGLRVRSPSDGFFRYADVSDAKVWWGEVMAKPPAAPASPPVTGTSGGGDGPSERT